MLYLTIYKRRDEAVPRFKLHEDYDTMNREGYGTLTAEWAFDVQIDFNNVHIVCGDWDRFPPSQRFALVAGVMAMRENPDPIVKPLIAKEVSCG